MTTHALAVGDRVRVILDPRKPRRIGQSRGTITRIGREMASVRFDADDEFTYSINFKWLVREGDANG